MWLAPPCTTFGSLINLRSRAAGGPLRTPANPWGDEANSKIAEGSRYWRRAMQLIKLCHACGIPAVLEHPQQSMAWRMSAADFVRYGMSKVPLDQCMFGQRAGTATLKRKSTILMCSAGLPWIKAVALRCDRSHTHGAPIEGRAMAAASGAYPPALCEKLAASYAAGLAA